MKSVCSLVLLLFAGFSMIAQVCPGGGSVTGTASLGAASSTASFGSSQSTGSFASATRANFTPTNNFLSNALSTGNYSSAKMAYHNVDGTPYMSKEDMTGQIVANNGTTIDNVPLKIDVYAKEILATNDKGDEIVLDTRFYKEISVEHEGQTLVFKKVNPKNPNQFYQVLYEDGDMVFYKEAEAKMREGMNRGIVKTNAKFDHRTNYFIKQGENDIAKIKLKKKDVFGLFPETEILAMQEYAKRKGIKLKKEADFVALFAGANDDD